MINFVFSKQKTLFWVGGEFKNFCIGTFHGDFLLSHIYVVCLQYIGISNKVVTNNYDEISWKHEGKGMTHYVPIEKLTGKQK